MFVLNHGKYDGNIQKSLNVDGSIISTTHYVKKNDDDDWHCHENPHISFVFEGAGKSETPNKKKFSNNVFFYNSGEKHRWVSHSDITKSANIEVSEVCLQKYDLSLGDLNETLNKNIDAKLLMLQIQKEMLINDSESFIAIQTLLLELLTYAEPRNSFNPKWVKTLKVLLNDKWNKRLTLTELAKKTDVHPVTISKYFRKYFNCTLGEYQRKIKINKSLALIKNKHKSLTEISYTCGFSDQSHFIRNFKMLTGFSPNKFRKL